MRKNKRKRYRKFTFSPKDSFEKAVFNVPQNIRMVVEKATYNKTSYNTPGYPDVLPLPWHEFSYRSFHTISPLQLWTWTDWNTTKGQWQLLSQYTANAEHWLGAQSYDGWDSQHDLVYKSHVKAAKKLSDQRASMGEFLGEVHKTANMFIDTTRRFTKCFIALRKFNLREAYHALDLSPSDSNDFKFLNHELVSHKRYGSNPFLFAGNAWLQLQYGWKPFIADLVGACTLLYDKASGVNPPERCVGTVSESYDLLVRPSLRPLTAVVRSEFFQQQTCVLYVRLTSESARTSNQLGIANLPQIAWNLFPYSFVVDKFIDIDTFISNISYSMGYEFLQGSDSFKSTLYGTTRVEGSTWTAPWGQTYNVGGGATSKTRGRAKSRTLLTSFPILGLHAGSVVETFREGLPQNTSHVLSAAALSLQQMARAFTGETAPLRRR